MQCFADVAEQLLRIIAKEAVEAIEAPKKQSNTKEIRTLVGFHIKGVCADVFSKEVKQH